MNMKKLILLCLVAFVTVAAKAQFYVGGSLGASYEKVKVEGESTDFTRFVLSPEFGYNIDKTIAVGATLGFGYGKNDDDDQTVYEIAPYIRATFARLNSVRFFAEGTLFLNHSKISIESAMPGYEYSYNTWGAAVRPGFLVNLSNNINLIGKATLLQYSKSEKNDIDTKSWKIGIPNEFTLGILVDF